MTLVLGLLNGSSAARNFPDKPITLIVPWPAGGATDVQMRSLAKSTEKYLGRPIVIVNRAGASGTLGPIQMAATAKPDGYTISQIPISVLRAPFVMRTSFDPISDLTYIIGLTGYTFGIVVRNDLRWKTFREFLDYAKAHPGEMSFGSSGVGTTPHLFMMQIARQLHIDWVHVPFKGSSDSIRALLGGHIDAIAEGSTWASMVDSGRLRLLVTWGARRASNWPDVPTVKEMGIDIDASAPYGIAGPSGMDPKVVKLLHDAFKKGMMGPSHLATIAKLNQNLHYLNSREYHELALKQIAEQKRLIQKIGPGLE